MHCGVCSSKAVTAAKVHCILLGHGVPIRKFKFTGQCVSPQVLEELTGLLHRNDVSRASLCRRVLVYGEETAVRYWQDTVLKAWLTSNSLEFPNGVKLTYIYTYLPTNSAWTPCLQLCATSVMTLVTLILMNCAHLLRNSVRTALA